MRLRVKRIIEWIKIYFLGFDYFDLIVLAVGTMIGTALGEDSRWIHGLIALICIYLLIKLITWPIKRKYNITSDDINNFKSKKAKFLKETDASSWIYDEELIDNQAFILEKIKENPFAFYYASNNLKSYKEVALSAVKDPECGYLLQYASEELRNDKEVVTASLMLESNRDVFKFASHDLRNDKEFVLWLLQSMEILWIKQLSEELSNDEEFLLKIIKLHPKNAIAVSPALRKNREFVLDAVAIVGGSLHFFPNFKDDRTVVYMAIASDGHSFSRASKRLQKDRELALFAVKAYANILQLLIDKFKDDKEIVLIAVKEVWYTLEHASERLRSDKEVVLADITSCEDAIQYVGKILLEDKVFLVDLKEKFPNLVVPSFIKGQFKND